MSNEGLFSTAAQVIPVLIFTVLASQFMRRSRGVRANFGPAFRYMFNLAVLNAAAWSEVYAFWGLRSPNARADVMAVLLAGVGAGTVGTLVMDMWADFIDQAHARQDERQWLFHTMAAVSLLVIVGSWAAVTWLIVDLG